MKIRELKKMLSIFNEDTEILVRSCPKDLAEPLGIKHILVTEATHDKCYGLDPSRIVISGYIPHEESK